MTTLVSVAGAGSGSLLVPFNGATNTAIAQQLAAAINAIKQGGTGNFAVYTSGAAPAPTGAAYNQLQIDSSSTVTSPITVPSGYNTLVDNSLAPATVTGGANLNVIAGVNGLNFTDTTAGSETVAVGGGTNVINLGNLVNGLIATGTGNNAAYLGGNGTITGATLSSNLFFGSNVAGNATQILTQGAADTVVAGAGNATISVGSAATGAKVYGGTGSLVVTDRGANDTVIGGSGQNTITASGTGGSYALNGTSVMVDNFGPETVYAGSGASTIFSSANSDLIFGPTGSGGLEFVGSANNSTIQASTGNVSVFGNSGSSITYTGSGSGISNLSEGSGQETINASGTSKNLFASGGSGQSLLVGGSGNDTIFVGSGNNTLTGGAGQNLFVAESGIAGGADIVSDFNTNDFVFLLGYGSQAISNAINNATTSNGSPVTVSGGTATSAAGSSLRITLSDQTQITFSGVNSLSSANFRSF